MSKMSLFSLSILRLFSNKILEAVLFLSSGTMMYGVSGINGLFKNEMIIDSLTIKDLSYTKDTSKYGSTSSGSDIIMGN